MNEEMAKGKSVVPTGGEGDKDANVSSRLSGVTK